MATVRALPVNRDDASIVEGILAGEAWASMALFDRYARDVERVLTSVLGVDHELADLIQDVFLRALEGMASVENPARLRSWMVAISVYTARERIRRRKRKWWMIFMPHDAVPDCPSEACELRDHELVDATYRVLERIEAEDRIALSLRLLAGMDVMDVAKACGVSRATIKRRISRGEARFRELAADEPALAEWADGGGI